MSTVKSNNVQIGQSVTATNNFTWYQPASPDGTVRLGNGNSGSVTDLVTLTSAGNLGIGTSSPSFPNGSGLAVYNTTVPRIKLANSTTGDAATDGTQLLVSGSDFYIQQREAASVIISTNNSDRVTIDSSGNLGLGVTPSAWATYAGNIQTSSGAIASYSTTQLEVIQNAYYNGGWIYKASGYASGYLQQSGVHKWVIAPSGTAGNAISFTQAMTLDASGNLLVGKTSASANGTGIWAYPAGGINLTVGGTTGYVAGFYTGGSSSTNAGAIYCNSSTTVQYLTSSDQRLKTNVTPAGSAIQSILDFPVDQFDWISSGEHQDFGAIAQKAINVIPEMIHAPDDPEEMWGIDWSKAVPRLIKTIQELSAELNELKKKVNA